jgi:uncharacterized FlaG/YvyC family protein
MGNEIQNVECTNETRNTLHLCANLMQDTIKEINMNIRQEIKDNLHKIATTIKELDTAESIYHLTAPFKVRKLNFVHA